MTSSVQRARPTPQPWSIALLIALLASGCGGSPPEGQTGAARSQAGTPAAELALASKPIGKKKRSRRGPQSSTGTAWRNMTFFVPDALEGYRARTATEGHEVDLTAGMSLSSVRRAYGRDDVLVEIELLDTAHCDRVRQVFQRSRDLTRESARAVIRPMRVKGFKALTQWLEVTKLARTSVLVAERFLVNVSVKPADSPALSSAVAEKLDWAGLEKLATQPAAPLEPVPEPIEPRSPAAPAAPAADSSDRADLPESQLPNASEPPDPLLASQPGADSPPK